MVFSVTLYNERGEHSNTDALGLTHFYHSWFTLLLHLHPLPFFVGHRTITRLLHCSKPDYACYILLLFLGRDPFSNDSTMSELSLFMVPFSKYVFHSSCCIEKKNAIEIPFVSPYHYKGDSSLLHTCNFIFVTRFPRYFRGNRRGKRGGRSSARSLHAREWTEPKQWKSTYNAACVGLLVSTNTDVR